MGLTTIQSGNTTDSELIASFTTLTQYKIQNCIINLPYKSSGYTSVELRIAGVNLLDCRDGTYNGTAHGLTYQTTKDSNNIVLSISVNGTTTQANAFRNLNYTSNVRRILPGKYATHCYSSQIGMLVVGLHSAITPTGYTNWYVADLSNWPHYNVTESWYNNSAATWVRLQAQPYTKNVAIDTVAKPMLCLESYSGCEYEPYTGNNYVITLPTTIYGGTVDLAKGIVVSTYASDGSKLSQNTTASFTPLKLFTKTGINNIWSYQGTVEISYDLVNMNHVSEARRKVIMSQPSLLQAEGQFITIKHAEFAPITHCNAIITPTQSGSGTPSPDNIRPIVGLSEINIIQSKKNLFDEIYTDIPINGVNPVYKSIYVGDNTVTFSTNCVRNTSGYSVLYALSGKVTSGADSASNGFYNGLTRVVQPTNGYVTIGYRASSGGADPRNYQTQIEIGDVATEYEPYEGIISTFDWSESAGTIYGLTLDLLTGTLTATYVGIVPFASVIGRNNNSQYYVKSGNVPGIKTNGHIYSNMFHQQGENETASTLGICYINSVGNIRFNTLTEYSTTADMLTAHPDLKFVYELNSPPVYQLTPQQLRTFRGINNITANGAHLYLSYWGHA